MISTAVSIRETDSSLDSSLAVPDWVANHETVNCKRRNARKPQIWVLRKETLLEWGTEASRAPPDPLPLNAPDAAAQEFGISQRSLRPYMGVLPR